MHSKKCKGTTSIAKNISTQIHRGKPKKQAIAIAFSEARKSGAHIPKKKK